MADLRTDTGFHRRIRLHLLLWLLVPLAVARAAELPSPEQAGPPPAESLAAASPADKVVDVQIRGNKSLPLDKILPSIRTRPDRPFDLELIEEDVRRLDHTHLFVNVKTYWQQVAGGRIVIFEVLERPLLQEVKFVGCKEIRKKTLQKESGLKVGDALDPFAIEEARRKLEEHYHSKGFTGARITLLEGDKPEDRRAIFLINEGTKQKVWQVEFIGNRIASGDRLATQIGSKHPFLYLFGGEFDRKKVDEDVEKLTAYYRGLGFFRARIGRELEFNEKENWVTVTFVIDEGPRYKVRNVSVIGNTKYTSDQLLADLKLTGDTYFNQAEMTKDVGSLQDKYGGIGYVFADIKADPRFLEEPAQLDLVYNITEGDRYSVGKINVEIKGEYPHTQITTILNRLSIKPGDIVDIREIRASERRLRASGLFESNPATGNAPKIVFSPPEQEEENKTQVADQPGSRRKPGTKFRGQSPDSASRDRKLDVTLDCGRYIGPMDEGRGTGDGGRGARGEGQGMGASAPISVPIADDDLSQMAGELADTLAQNRSQQQSRERLIPTQYTPDAGQTNPATQSTRLQWSNVAVQQSQAAAPEPK